MAGTIVANTINTDTGVFTTNNAYLGIAKAWLVYNGTGTPSITASFNISSVTYNSTGNYTLNFTTAMADANYTITSSAEGTGSTSYSLIPYSSGGAGTAPTTKTTTQCRVVAPQNTYCGSVVIHGN